LTTPVLTRKQLVLLQDNGGHGNFGKQAQTKFVQVHDLQVAEGCVVLILDYLCACGNNTQDHVKDDNADDTSCGIRLVSLRTTLVKAREVLGVRKSHREGALDV
jgi:hypothetical protein